MARIRSIKPGFCSSEDIAILPIPVRLHFAMLWTYSDDEGRGRDHPKLIKAELWPLDDNVTDADVEKFQATLAETGRIQRYEVDGRRYFQVTNWKRHQKPQKPRPSDYPPSPGCAEACGNTGISTQDGNGDTATVGLPSVVGGEWEGESSSSDGRTTIDDDDPRIREACALLAAESLKRRETELGRKVGDPERWRQTATDRRVAEHSTAAVAWLVDNPHSTSEQLAHHLDPPLVPDRNPIVAAIESRCAACGGSGWADVDDDGTPIPCQSCRVAS